MNFFLLFYVVNTLVGLSYSQCLLPISDIDYAVYDYIEATYGIDESNIGVFDTIVNMQDFSENQLRAVCELASYIQDNNIFRSDCIKIDCENDSPADIMAYLTSQDITFQTQYFLDLITSLYNDDNNINVKNYIESNTNEVLSNYVSWKIKSPSVEYATVNDDNLEMAYHFYPSKAKKNDNCDKDNDDDDKNGSSSSDENEENENNDDKDDQGSRATPVVLIPGFSVTKELFIDIAYSLSQEQGYDVLVMDPRGVGDTDIGPTLSYSIAQFTRDIADLMQIVFSDVYDNEDNIKPIVVGYSLGVIFAVEMAAEYSQLLSSIALTSGIAGAQNLVYGTLTETFIYLRTNDVCDTLYGTNALTFFNEEYVNVEDSMNTLSIYTNQLLAYANLVTEDETDTGEILQIVSFTEEGLENDSFNDIINTKTLIISGSGDVLINYQSSVNMYNQLLTQNSEITVLEIMDGIGHFYQFQDPQLFEEKLTNFIETYVVEQ